MKTPGVYVVEKNAFPNSVVEVATAVPAFIGYTKFAINGTKPLTGIPWRVSSLAEFIQYFGDAPKPQFSLTQKKDITNLFIAFNVDDGYKNLKKSTDAYAVAFATAFGAAGTAAAAKDKLAADATQDLKDATEKIRKDAYSKLTELTTDYAVVVNAYLAILTNIGLEAEALKGITDAKNAFDPIYADLKLDVPTKKLSDLNTANDALTAAVIGFDISTANAANKYFELNRTDSYNLYYNLRLFFANGGGPCYIVSVGSYLTDLSEELLTSGIDTLLKEQEPTMVLVPEAVSLDVNSCSNIQTAVLKHCGNSMSRVAILDIHNGFKDRKDENGDVVTRFREKIGTDFLDYAAAYYPWLNTSIVPENELSFLNLSKDNLNDFKNILKSYTPQLTAYIDRIGTSTDERELQTVHKVLYKQNEMYGMLVKEMQGIVNLLPPSAAMAGVYTLTDHTKEVWKTPANTSLSNVISTAVNISYAEQEDLNVPPDGKAINAIRYFNGEGIKVWGARTLDGNSLEWKYINVRRTMIMLEESIKNASKAFVFDPNVVNTWVIVRSTISNFLNGIWKRGGLAGAAPEDAFSVHVGLGETMTPEDILEGIMRITVLVAISRPAEFIEITFMQQMQKS